MCDYSLHAIASRPARLGEELRTAVFPSTCTRGFADPDEPNVAVCVLPGTELAFDRDVAWDRPFAFLRRTPTGKLVRFRQVNAHDPYVHHDAVEFPDGRTVLLTKLRPGQRATVVQLPVHHNATPTERPHEVTNPLVTLAPE